MSDKHRLGKDPGHILVIDDDDGILQLCQISLEEYGHQVELASSGWDGIRYLKKCDGLVDVVLLDYEMPEIKGLEVLRKIKKEWPFVEVIFMTGHPTVDMVLSVMKLGAFDYLQKPFPKLKEFVEIVEKAIARKKLVEQNTEVKEEKGESSGEAGMVGSSPAMKKVFDLIEQIARFDVNVFVHGETGTGKEKAARAIHEKSLRSKGPFIPVVCGAIPENLMESTLFGHRKGAFTGSTADKMGLIEAANGGTLFLDEVGDIPFHLQVKLLRVIQEGEILRVGDVRPTNVDVRVISATHKDLRKEIDAGNFREDFYFRLNVIELELPPLRKRQKDISLLAYHFLRMFASRFNKHEISEISPEVLVQFMSYGWPGNVRELEHVMARAVILENSPKLSVASLPDKLQEDCEAPPVPEEIEHIHLSFQLAKQRIVQQFEKSYLRGVLSQTNENISEAARLAGMDRSNFRRLLKKYAKSQDGLGVNT